jgi:hypothetical protein
MTTWSTGALRRVEAAADRIGRLLAELAAARRWRPRWWRRAGAWWSASPVAAAAAWWLDALAGCLERARVRTPDWWPEQLTAAALLAVLAALDVLAWRWLPA